jgi:hypothetical protein
MLANDEKHRTLRRNLRDETPFPHKNQAELGSVLAITMKGNQREKPAPNSNRCSSVPSSHSFLAPSLSSLSLRAAVPSWLAG